MEKALLEGQIAGFAAAGREAEAQALAPAQRRMQRFAERLDLAFALRPGLRAVAGRETVVCRCEDVALAALDGCRSWREAKLHTRCGMGACQGRVCGVATEYLFGWENAGVRPPVFPAAFSSMAGEMEESAPVVR
jgi:hypothetical protein